MKRFVIIPIFLNFIILCLILYFIFGSINSLVNNYISADSWVSWFSFIIKAIGYIIALVITSYIYSFVALTVGSPFYTMLSEKVEAFLNNKPVADTPLKQTIQEIPNTIGREIIKFIYRIPLLILMLISLFIPVIGQALIILIGAWCYSLDCTSYAYENNHISFKDTRASTWQHKMLLLTFGVIVWVFMLVPFFNMLIIPVAICGGTALWHDCLKHDFPELPSNKDNSN